MADRVASVATDLTLYDVNPSGKEIGRGAYGRVFEVDYQGTLCAAKEVHSVLLEWSQDEALHKITTDFLNECQIWSTIRHPCVVQFLGVYYPARDQYRLPVMIMEKMLHSLRGLVESYINIPLNVKVSILDQVCLGLRYLHSKNPAIVHRDLTPNNILLGGHLEAKISDLGVAKVMQTDSKTTMTNLPGTPDFMPPEALAKKPVYGPPLDVFSYGGVVLNVITQQWPEPTDREQLNPDTDRLELVSEVTRRQKYLNMFTGGSADLVPLVTSCLNDNPKKRPSMLQVSMEIKRVKDVCSHQTNRDGMSPIVWWAEVSGQSSSQQVTPLNTRLEKVTLGHEELREEVSVLKSEIDGLKVENNGLKVEVDGLKVENNDLKVQNNDLKIEVDSLKMENSSLKVDLKVENNGLKFEVDGNNGLKVENNGLNVQPNTENQQLKDVPWRDLTTPESDLSEQYAVVSKPTRKHKPRKRLAASVSDIYSVLPNPNRKDKSSRSLTTSVHVQSDLYSIDFSVPKTKDTITSMKQTVKSPTPGLSSCQNSIKWQEGFPARVGNAFHTAVLLDGKVYIGGGDEFGVTTYKIYVYNLATNSWSPSISFSYHWFAMTTLNNQLITAGGEDRKCNVTDEIFSLDGDELKEYTRMITPKCYVTAAGHQGTLIIVGGRDGQNRRLATTELFDSTTEEWYTTGALPLPHSELKLVIVDNALYFLGGNNQHGRYSPHVLTAPLDTLSSHQLKWSTQQDTPWCYSAPVSIQGRHLLTVGGMKKTGSRNVRTSDILMFNKISHSWEVIGQIPSTRSGLAAVSIADNKIFLVGGYDDKSQFTDTVWIGSCDHGLQ